MREAAAGKTFSFADFELDGAKRRLLKKGEFVPLNSKAFDLLLVLVENCGQLVSKDEIFDQVWEGQFVEENNLTRPYFRTPQNFRREKRREPQFILTVPGKGYTFIVEVSSNNSPPAPKIQPKNNSLVETVVFEETETDESFIGRSEEIVEIKKLLRQNDFNLLTLTGAGGTGKTRLAQKVVRELRTDFPASIFFVELAVVNDAESAVSLIAQTLDVTEVSGKSLLESIKEFLQMRRTLLVLDNFEHLLSLAPLVREFLESSTLLKILVTSRAPLRLKNEREFLVKPLELPPTDTDFSLEKLAEYPAILLFCKRAQIVKPTFLLATENISPVVKICQRLDGLPLAIELAAARITLLSPQSILARLENSLNLLTGGAKDSPERQQTMRGTIQWSYDLLTENEQFLFRRLAIFAGGFTVEAAEAVVSSQWSVVSKNTTNEVKNKNPTTNHRLLTTVLDILDSLIEKNLLVTKEQADGNARLRMLEVVREFAFEILQKSGELTELQKIHANYFLSLAEEAEKFLLSETGNEWLEKLENEHDNLRAALNWALKYDAEIAARIAAALRFFWLNHSHLSEGLRLSRAALQLTENNFSEARSKLLLSNGLFLRNQGDLESARKSYEKSLAESKKLGNVEQIIKANHGLGAVAVLQKDFISAQKYNEEALALSREMGDKMQIAYSLCSLADLEMSRKNLSAARPPLEECLTLSQTLGNNRLLNTAYFNLGTVDFWENKYNAATLNLTKSLRIADEMDNKTMISCSLEGFAALAAIGGKDGQSAKLAGAAETLRESINYQLEPAEESFRDNYLNKIRATLDEKTFAKLYKEGKSLDLNEIVSLIIAGQSLEKRTLVSENGADEMSEIIIERHSIERIIIEDEIRDFPNEIQIAQPTQLTAPTKQSLFSNPLMLLSSFAIVLLAVISGWWLWRNEGKREVKPLKFTKLTNSGKITNVTITPDGKYTVFSQVEKDGEGLWLRQIATGSQNQILKPQAVNFVGLAVTPDNNFIYATIFSNDLPDPQVWRIPLLGGATEHIKGVTTGAAVSFSPDGKRMAFTESRSSIKQTHLEQADLNGANKQFLLHAKDEERSLPNFKANPVAWSPDGREVACAVEEKAADGSRKSTVLLINTNDKSERHLTERRWNYVENITWIDAENLALIGDGKIWKVSHKTGETNQISDNLSEYSWIAGADGNLLTVKKDVVSKVSIANFDAASQKLENRQIFDESGYISSVNWAADGRIVYTSTASGQPEIWRAKADGSEQIQLTVNAKFSLGLAVSPSDGSMLFASLENGKHSLHLADSEGKNIRQIVEGTEDVWGTFTPDGKSIIFQRGLNNKKITLWRFELADKKLTQLTQNHALHPIISPDGTQIAHYFMDSETDNLWRIRLISTAMGEFLGKINLPKDATERRMRWHPDGQLLSQIAYQGEDANLLFLSLKNSEIIRKFNLGKGDLQWFEWSKDGKKIIVSQSNETQDVILLSQ